MHTRAESLIVVSGGLDSTVLTYAAVLQGKQRVRGVFFDLRRTAQDNERANVNLLSADLNVPIEIVDLGGLDRSFRGHLSGELFGVVDPFNKGARTKELAVGLGGFASVVSLSAFYAHAIEVDRVAFGLLDVQTQALPGIGGFLCGLSDALAVLQAGLPRIEFELPFADRCKADIVRLGAELGVPFERTWSCFGSGVQHCGTCYGCQQRRIAFERARICDVTGYAA